MAPSQTSSQQPAIPKSFTAKKRKILADLAVPETTYTDNSPKGSVDVQIRDLIDEINAYDGFVTTSSCAGRVAVFVEGGGGGNGGGVGSDAKEDVDGEGEGDGIDGDGDFEGGYNAPPSSTKGDTFDVEVNGDASGARVQKSSRRVVAKTSPGGKGGGRWLYVSHDPISWPDGPEEVEARVDEEVSSDGIGHERRNTHEKHETGRYMKLFNLSPSPHPTTSKPNHHENPATTTSPEQTPQPPQVQVQVQPQSRSPPLPSPPKRRRRSPPRLIHLTFSPLILHIHCATLAHARPLLSAAINAGFRESGIQSLRILDDVDTGVMLAIRTAGLAFETVVGVLEDGDGDGEGGAGAGGEGAIRPVVTEEYLALCAGVVNERFRWNDERRERLRREIGTAMRRVEVGGQGKGKGKGKGVSGGSAWEEKDERRRRKREEGLLRQQGLGAGSKSQGFETSELGDSVRLPDVGELEGLEGIKGLEIES